MSSGSDGDAGNCARNIYAYCDPPKEEPEPKFAATDGDSGYCDYNPIKKELEPELGNGEIDADDCDYDYDPPKEEPELKPAATIDDAVTDDGQDVNYGCSYCGVNLCSQEFKVQHEVRCKVQTNRRELDSKITEVYHCGYCRCPFVSKEYKEQHQQKSCRKRPVAMRKKDFNGTYFKCDKCKFVTKWKNSLERHVFNHNKNNAEWFTCTQCSYKSVHKTELLAHTKIHGISFNCCCPTCGKSFRSKRTLDDHLVRHHSNEPDEVSKLITSKIYTCNICNQYKTTSKTNYNEHVAITHFKGVGCKKYECPRCPYSTFRKAGMNRHSKTHLEQKGYRCTVCKKQFIEKRDLDWHIVSNHAKKITLKPRRCESSTPASRDIDDDGYCDPPKVESEPELCDGDRDAIAVDDYSDHIPPKEEPESKFVVTNGDGDDGVASNDYGRNVASKADDCYYNCDSKEEPEPEPGNGDGDAGDVDDCDASKEEPETELAAIGDEADAAGVLDVGYDCSHCGVNLCTQEFKVEHELRCKAQMQGRELKPEITKLYHCGYCRCPFLIEEYREQHQQKYCRKRPVVRRRDSSGPYFECDKCEFVTKYKHSLARHVLNHNKSNGEWIACMLCSYKTAQKCNMTIHMKIHNNAFNCCCQICGKCFRTKQYLDNHLLKRHSDASDVVSKSITSNIYTCDICNKYRTTVMSEFNKHVTITHLKGVGCQEYECPHCLYSSFRKRDLKMHLRTHAERKDYRCIACEKLFTRKVQLDSHVLHYHADNVDLVKTISSKIHSCESCSFKTVQVTHLERHVRSKHV